MMRKVLSERWDFTFPLLSAGDQLERAYASLAKLAPSQKFLLPRKLFVTSLQGLFPTLLSLSVILRRSVASTRF